MTTRRSRVTRLAALGAFSLFCGSGSVMAQPADWQTVSEKDKSALAYAVAVGQEDKIPLYACRAAAGPG